jgi:hypothetical protein
MSIENLETLTTEEIEKYSDLLRRIMFPDEWTFSKVLWRMSSGSRTKAITITRKYLKHYNFPNEMNDDDFNACFDIACADVNDGFDVEWAHE